MVLPKIVDHEAKKKQIMQAAIKIFNEKGFAGARITDIAIKAAISRTTIYQYFRSKEHLFEEIVDFVLDDIEKDMKSIIDNADLTFYDKVTEIVRNVIMKHNYTSVFLTLLSNWELESSTTDAKYRLLEKYNNELQVRIEKLVEQAVIKGEISNVCYRSTKVVIHSLLTGLIRHLSVRDEQDVEEYIMTVVKLLNGLKVEEVA